MSGIFMVQRISAIILIIIKLSCSSRSDRLNSNDCLHFINVADGAFPHVAHNYVSHEVGISQSSTRYGATSPQNCLLFFFFFPTTD